MKVLLREDMSTVAPIPITETAGPSQKTIGHHGAEGKKSRPIMPYPAAFTAIAIRTKEPTLMTSAGSRAASTLAAYRSASLTGVYSSASRVRRSRSPTNESAAMIDETMSGTMRNIGANI